MTSRARVRLRAVGRTTPAEQAARDAGISLIEVVVSMVLMGIFLSMFAAGIAKMYNAADRTDSLTQTSAQVDIAFDRLDKEIRYASAINPPGKGTDGNWYVEFLNTSSGTSACTQLRVANSQLQQRTWTGTPTGAPTWTPLASSVAAPGATSPFTWYAAQGSQLTQRLKVTLNAVSGVGSAQRQSTTMVTFSAMNSSQGGSLSNDGVTLICQTGVARP
jgi:Tfp pilus assembly protein PilV